MREIFFNLIAFSFFTSFLFVFAEDTTVANQEIVLQERTVDNKDEAAPRERKTSKGKKGKGKKILVPEEDILLNLDRKQTILERTEQADDEEKDDN